MTHYLTLAEAAQYVCRSKRWVLQQAKAGLFPADVVWDGARHLVNRDHLEAWQGTLRVEYPANGPDEKHRERLRIVRRAIGRAV